LPALDSPRVIICPLHVAGSGTGKAVGSVGQSIHSTCGARYGRRVGRPTRRRFRTVHETCRLIRLLSFLPRTCLAGPTAEKPGFFACESWQLRLCESHSGGPMDSTSAKN